MKEAVKVYLEPEVHRALRLLAADTTGCSQSALASQIIESFLMEPVVLVPQPPAEGKARMKKLDSDRTQPKGKKPQEQAPQAQPHHPLRFKAYHPTVIRRPTPLPLDEAEENGQTLEELTRKTSMNRNSGKSS